ncbi:MAG: hypothetical protein V1709_00740 [Planctomycetota bacterium]
MKLVYQGTLSPVYFPKLKGGITVKHGDTLELSPADFGGNENRYKEVCKQFIDSRNFREHKEYKLAPEIKINVRDNKKETLTRKKK